MKHFCTAGQQDGLASVLWRDCCQQQLLQLQDYSSIVNLPQLLGNRLELRLDQLFTPRLFLLKLMKVACAVLEKCHHSMGSHDYSMSNLAHFIAKIITSGPDSGKCVHACICNTCAGVRCVNCTPQLMHWLT